ncbi:kinase-like domain-containing protein [Aspergillus californicus]
MIRRGITEMATTDKYIGASGTSYCFKELPQESGLDRFVLKDIPKAMFDNFNEEIRPQLPKSLYVRLPWDTVPGQRILVYKYLPHDFLALVKENISLQARKQILKASLLGIADLHDQHIVHLDMVVERVQLIDLENVAYLPPGRWIKGMLAGNDNWRSPEAHFKGKLNKPTDIFSFGLVCIYAMLGQVVLGPDEDFRKHESQGPLNHIADDQISCHVLEMLWEKRADERAAYHPFPAWPNSLDPEFKDLTRGLTNLDPAKRLSARQALEHPWFVQL